MADALSVATSALRNDALRSPSCSASAAAVAIASSEKSMPVNRLAGNACAMRLTAYPLPQPKSATSRPPSKPSGSPSTRGSTIPISALSKTSRLRSPITA
ncbi:Uncharacterised protein [Mycobacteroides abscessus subsp. massiliense]|nr:Uncharacterised protein [Mycobacteroides abscessus subsp. massiliense]